MGDTHAAFGKVRNTYIFWLGKTYGERPLGKPRRRWENNKKRSLEGRVLDLLDLG